MAAEHATVLQPVEPADVDEAPEAYNYGRLVQTPENLKAYAKYFVKYIQAYAEHGITVNQLHVQNEVFADQKFPSALWDSEALKVFIRDYLGPAFDEAGLSTDIWLGTLNGPEDMAWTGGGYGMTLNNYNRFVDNILFDDARASTSRASPTSGPARTASPARTNHGRRSS
mgnify:CR=1 FL=1